MDSELTDVAWDLYDKGINTFPLSYRSKKPIKGFEWRPLCERRITEDEIREWFCTDVRTNIALLCGEISRIVAVDADSKENVRSLFSELPRTPAMQKTPNGGHLLYRLPEGVEVAPAVKTTIKGIQCDIRGEASYIAISPSVHPTGKPYQWINWPWNLKDVPEFDPEWIDCEPVADNSVNLVEKNRQPLTRSRVKNVDGYLSRIESIQGQGGSSGLVRAAAVCRDAGLSEAQTMGKLMEWNVGPTVNPSWSTEELARAVSRTYAKATV